LVNDELSAASAMRSGLAASTCLTSSPNNAAGNSWRNHGTNILMVWYVSMRPSSPGSCQRGHADAQ